MANLPEAQNKSAAKPLPPAIEDALLRGMKPAAIAQKVYPNDAHKRKILRKRLWRRLTHDQQLQAKLAGRAQAQMLLDLVPTTEAVGRRAKRGRIDAAKLVFEVTGFHNPRVKHDHSGDIKITVDIPRPVAPKAIEGSAEEVTDADVVEDS